jgi:hypothetical protein
MYDIEQAIRERAYHLWIEGGCQDGHAETHWLAAQRAILSASVGEPGTAPSKRPDAVAKPKQAKVSRRKRAA